MANVEKYLEIGKAKKQEKKDEKWAEKATKYAAEAHERPIKDQERMARREAVIARWKERGGKIQETGKNVLGRIGKTAENASSLGHALPEIRKDALTGLKQRAENGISQLMEKGSKAADWCSRKIEGVRSGVPEWIDGLKDALKMRQIRKSAEKCASIGHSMGEMCGELKSSKNQEIVRKKMLRLSKTFELGLTIKGGDRAEVSKSLEQGFAIPA